MNLEAGREFAEYFTRLPLDKSAQIRHGNALRLDWEAFVPPHALHYILGNPPFVGKQFQSAQQKEDFEFVAGNVKGTGVLDFVAGWYLKAAQYLSGGKEGFVSRDKQQFADVRFVAETPSATKRGRAGANAPQIEDIFVTLERETDAARQRIRCAFVSTNSISQGEQVGVLWSELFRRGMKIHFAHRTFKWSNEAPDRAAVHCVIVGFGRQDLSRKRLFDYPDIDGPAHEITASNINPYLVDAPDVVLPNRREPLCKVPPISFWSKATDGGNLIMTKEQADELLDSEPQVRRFIRT